MTTGYDETYLDYDGDSTDELFVEEIRTSVTQTLESHANNPKYSYSFASTPVAAIGSTEACKVTGRRIIKEEITEKSMVTEVVDDLFTLRALELMLSRLERELRLWLMFSPRREVAEEASDDDAASDEANVARNDAAAAAEIASGASRLRDLLAIALDSSQLCRLYTTAVTTSLDRDTSFQGFDCDGFNGPDRFLARLLKLERMRAHSVTEPEKQPVETDGVVALTSDELTTLLPFDRAVPGLLVTLQNYQLHLKQLRSTSVHEDRAEQYSSDGGCGFKLSMYMNQKVNTMVCGRVYQYWLLRRSTRVSPLLRAHHSFMMPRWRQQENLLIPLPYDYSSHSLRDASTRLLQIRDDLTRALDLVDRVRRRERLKRDLIRNCSEEWQTQLQTITKNGEIYTKDMKQRRSSGRLFDDASKSEQQFFRRVTGHEDSGVRGFFGITYQQQQSDGEQNGLEMELDVKFDVKMAPVFASATSSSADENQKNTVEYEFHSFLDSYSLDRMRSVIQTTDDKTAVCGIQSVVPLLLNDDTALPFKRRGRKPKYLKHGVTPPVLLGGPQKTKKRRYKTINSRFEKRKRIVSSLSLKDRGGGNFTTPKYRDSNGRFQSKPTKLFGEACHQEERAGNGNGNRDLPETKWNEEVNQIDYEKVSNSFAEASTSQWLGKNKREDEDGRAVGNGSVYFFRPDDEPPSIPLNNLVHSAKTNNAMMVGVSRLKSVPNCSLRNLPSSSSSSGSNESARVIDDDSEGHNHSTTKRNRK